MRWARRATAAIAAVLPALLLLGAAPVHAGVFGLKEEITGYHWSPRTGNVSVRVVAECPRRMWLAEVGITLTQKRVTASDNRDVPCDGDPHTLILRLHSKHGRFHPGVAEAWFRTGECVSDYCGYAEGQLPDVRIPAPGQADRSTR